MKNTRTKTLIIVFVSLVFVASIYFIFFKNGTRGADLRRGFTESNVADIELAELGKIEELGNEKIYRSEPFGFTFRVPGSFTFGEFNQSDGRMVLVNTGESSVQIFISAYDEPAETLTFEKISSDVPDLQLYEPELFAMTGGQNALVFIGEDATFGNTREVWLVHRGHLFQILTPVESQETLATLLNTWELF